MQKKVFENRKKAFKFSRPKKEDNVEEEKSLAFTVCVCVPSTVEVLIQK